MGVQDRDWYREKYQELTKPQPTKPQRPRVDELIRRTNASRPNDADRSRLWFWTAVVAAFTAGAAAGVTVERRRRQR